MSAMTHTREWVWNLFPHNEFKETVDPNISVVVIKGLLVSLSIQPTDKGFLCSQSLLTYLL